MTMLVRMKSNQLLFLMDGFVDLVWTERPMEKEQCQLIVEHNTIPSELKLVCSGFILQQDNDPKHSSKLCRGYVEHNEL